jgi:hypothetical protein
MRSPFHLREHLNRRNYKYLLLTISAMIFSPFFFPEASPENNTEWTKLIYSGFFTLVLLIGLNLTKPGSVVYKIKGALFFAAFILTWFNVFADHHITDVAAVISCFLFFGLVGRTLFISIRSAKEVNLDVITGAISGYLILGICFSFLLGTLYTANPNSFSFPVEHHNMRDIYYFTFVSMTTLGYGEITPATYPAKGFSLMLTLAGQLYLTVVIATLIGKFLNTTNR